MRVIEPLRLFGLMSLALTLLYGCGTRSLPQYVPTPAVSCPPLPPSAQQTAKPSWCSPSCTSALTNERENSAQRLMKLTPED